MIKLFGNVETEQIVRVGAFVGRIADCSLVSGWGADKIGHLDGETVGYTPLYGQVVRDCALRTSL